MFTDTGKVIQSDISITDVNTTANTNMLWMCLRILYFIFYNIFNCSLQCIFQLILFYLVLYIKIKTDVKCCSNLTPFSKNSDFFIIFVIFISRISLKVTVCLPHGSVYIIVRVCLFLNDKLILLILKINTPIRKKYINKFKIFLVHLSFWIWSCMYKQFNVT